MYSIDVTFIFVENEKPKTDQHCLIKFVKLTESPAQIRLATNST